MIERSWRAFAKFKNTEVIEFQAVAFSKVEDKLVGEALNSSFNQHTLRRALAAK